jgi:hypothetical protein
VVFESACACIAGTAMRRMAYIVKRSTIHAPGGIQGIF